MWINYTEHLTSMGKMIIPNLNTEWKSPTGTHWRRWDDNILKMDLREGGSM
jgi:hypothetical protein